MLPLYGLRKKLGLADRGGRKNWFRRRLSPLERTIAELDVGQAGGEPSGDPELTRRIVLPQRRPIAEHIRGNKPCDGAGANGGDMLLVGIEHFPVFLECARRMA